MKKKKEITKFMRRVYRRQMTTSLGGNISFKKKNGKILITPSQIDKDNLESKDILVIEPSGKTKPSKRKSSMETQLHLGIYEVRKDINAIIHAHTFWGSLLAVSDLQLANDISDESFFMIHKVEFCNYATMGSADLANEVKLKIQNADILILANHGVVSTGKDLVQALERLEVLENIAHYSYLQNQNLTLKHLTTEAKMNIENNFGIKAKSQ
jgi:L-fuculose-phosphate aldolase